MGGSKKKDIFLNPSLHFVILSDFITFLHIFHLCYHYLERKNKNMIIPNNFAPAMLITLFAGLSTAIGGGIAFIVKKDNLKALSVGLGFSAGVMVFVSFMDMLPEAGKLLAQHFPTTHEWLTLAGFVAGLIVAILIDYFLPDHIDTEDVLHPDGPAHRNYRIKRAGIFTAIAICVHNFPEGMATFFTTTQNITLGLSVGLAIAIHNIPEGIAVALPMYHVTGKKRYAMLYAALSGITEPIGALVGMFIFGLFLPQVLIGALMAAVAGIMIYISFDTLLPLAKEYGDWHQSIVGIISGILVIWVSLILIGG